jgi:hypothetical protein
MHLERRTATNDRPSLLVDCDDEPGDLQACHPVVADDVLHARLGFARVGSVLQLRREQLYAEIIHLMAEANYLAEEWKDIYDPERAYISMNRTTPNATENLARKPLNYCIDAGLLTEGQPLALLVRELTQVRIAFQR